jgi:hypothetical protein
MSCIKMQMLEKDVNTTYLVKVETSWMTSPLRTGSPHYLRWWVVDFGFYCEDKFIGTVNASQLHKYINGMEIEHTIDEEDWLMHNEQQTKQTATNGKTGKCRRCGEIVSATDAYSHLHNIHSIIEIDFLTGKPFESLNLFVSMENIES